MYTGKERRQPFELNPKDKKNSAIMVDKRRTLIGSAEACDIILKFPDISPIHAILEITKGENKIYDMNTPGGTFVNGEKVTVGQYKEGDSLKFGTHEFIYKKFVKEEAPPPILNMLDPSIPPMVVPKKDVPKVVPTLPKMEGVKAPRKPSYTPRVAYPLGDDPKAYEGPYLYEDVESLYPIFDYEPDKLSVEVIINFNDKIYSVDYLPLKNKTYNLVGFSKKFADIELPTLRRKEKINFIEIAKGEVLIIPPPGFERLILNDQKKAEGSVILKEDDLVRFYKSNCQILVRLGPKPPFVKRAPFLSKDGQLSKILAGTYITILLLLFLLSVTDVEEVKELEKEKAPERIAKILYKPKPIEKPVEKLPEVVQTTPKPEPEKVPEIKKVEVEKVAPKPAPETPPKKAEPKTAKVEVKKPIVTKTESPKKAPPAPPKAVAPKAPPKKVVAKAAPGKVETFKLDFKPNISKTLSKGEQIEAASSSAATSDSEVGIAGQVGAGGATSVKKADMATGVGTLSGITKGSLDTSEGVSGLSDKKSVYSVGIPGQTVVLGSMDPDLIRKILRDNYPLFRNCYQRELEGGGETGGLVKMKFEIGATGSVTKASATSSEIGEDVRGCVVGVLRGIQFPRPMGGGVVEVVQPLNLQPKKI